MTVRAFQGLYLYTSFLLPHAACHLLCPSHSVTAAEKIKASQSPFKKDGFATRELLKSGADVSEIIGCLSC